MSAPLTPRAAAPASSHGAAGEALGPGFGDVACFSSTADEYAALRGGAALVDRSARMRMLFSGAKAAEALTGLVTNDVLSLKSGHGLFAAALTVKGKVIADLRVFARDEDLLVDVPRNAADGFVAMIRKYVNPRLARYTDASATVRTLGVFGPRAHVVVAAALGADAATLASFGPYQHIYLEIAGASATLASVPDLGVPGFDLFVPESRAAALWTLLAHEGAVPAGTLACEIARVEAGRPLWGVDMDENTLAQEANFDSLGGISYTKGCYTGQETVARVHFRGHVNRFLRGVQSAELIPPGAQLFDGAGERVGDVRSSVESPRMGPVAIAMLKRSAESGSELLARWEGGTCAALVRELPFD